MVFLPASVNHSRPAFFVLDTTAAASSVGVAWTHEVGLTALPAPILNLAGVDVPFAALRAIEQDDFGARVGRPYEGTLGNDFFSRVVVEIDYARRSVRLYDPGIYRYAGRGVAFHLALVDGVPVIQAAIILPKIKPLEAFFAINTALDASVVMADRFAEAHGFFSRRLKVSTVLDPVVDAEQQIVLARLMRFQIGNYSAEDVLTEFSKSELPARSGTFKVAGEIGAGMLRRFIVILDYPHHQVYLEPTAHLAEEDEEDKSGISVMAKGPGLKTFEVLQVQPGSPASEAKIEKGDVIASVDDEAAADLTLAELRALFSRRRAHLQASHPERNGQNLEVMISMRRLL